MPFLSYQVCVEDAIRNAGLFVARGGCDCVKVEVDRRHARTAEAMSAASIPVMAHLGLRPQSIQSVGGYKVQGKSAREASKIIADAKMMEQAGAVALLLEAVPSEVAQIIAESTELPVIGIVAGPHCDGQVLVMHDMLGYGGGHPPRSVKQYARLHDVMVGAFRAYAADVAAGEFPARDHGVSLEPAELEELRQMLSARQLHKDVSPSR
jgi:3-methyl-2-oxobutanoate hydroxymethyltransferase